MKQGNTCGADRRVSIRSRRADIPVYTEQTVMNKTNCTVHCYCKFTRTIGVFLVLCAFGFIIFTGCAGTPRYTHSLGRQAGETPISPGSFRQTGVASYYATEFNGRKTASGERYNMNDLTAAHPTLPFGIRVRVTNLSNDQSVVVRINDRGPFKKSRIIDVSYGAAEKIGLIAGGSAKVRVETVK